MRQRRFPASEQNSRASILRERESERERSHTTGYEAFVRESAREVGILLPPHDAIHWTPVQGYLTQEKHLPHLGPR